MQQKCYQRGRLIAGGLTVLLMIGLASIWTRHGPPPDGAFVLILGYFVCIALWGAVELFLALRRPPPPQTENPTPPIEPSPVGAPLGPRKPAPLVAHAVPAEELSGGTTQCGQDFDSSVNGD
jgi:hypothetical protein